MRPTPSAKGIPKSVNIILLGPTGERQIAAAPVKEAAGPRSWRDPRVLGAWKDIWTNVESSAVRPHMRSGIHNHVEEDERSHLHGFLSCL